jgi:tetratricopeptide (TPR) repeat protein
VFAVHPVFAESVAWITEQKNTLSGVFFLASALVYLRFDAKRTPGLYAAALFLFACAVLSKTVTAPLPAALLVIFWWRRGGLSLKRDVLPLLPWFAVGAAAGLFSAWVEKTYIGAYGDPFALSVGQRILVSGRVVWFYLGKLFWPAKLVFIYPRWEVSTAVWWQFLFPAGALALAAALWLYRRGSRGPLAALLLFAGLLFPIMGFFNVYAFVYSFVADHFQYLAAMPVIALVTAGFSGLGGPGDRPRLFRRIAASAAIGVLSLLTWRQSSMYTDIETFYRTIIRENPACWMAYNNLGNVMRATGRPGEALVQYREAMRLHPEAQDHYNIGIIYADEGRTADAIAEFDEAVRLKPEYPDALYNRGVAHAISGQVPQAVADYEAALRLEPDLPEAHNSLGFALVYLGRLPEAIDQCGQAVRLRPGFRDAQFNLGFALAAARRFPEAIEHYGEAVRLDPSFPEGHNYLGIALEAAGRMPEAIREYREALRLRPDYTEAAKNLAAARHRSGP